MAKPEDIEIFYFLFAGTLAMFLLSAGIILFVLLYQKKLYQHNLKLQSIETEYQMKLVQSNMEEVENERIRISKDLHDEIGSIFSVISIKFDQLTQAINSPSAETEKVIIESKQTIEHGIKSIRRISHNMIPPALEMFGLTVAIDDLCSQYEGGPSGLPIELIAPDEIKIPSKYTALVIYRIVQELLNNTIKHAEATKVEITIVQVNQDIVFTYKDNGKGFNYNDRKNRKGMGLLNIENRVQLLQADIQVTSAPDMGTEITIQIPYQTPINHETSN